MSDKSGIQWTDATWNPVIGCQRVSPGCQNCYAEVQARRIAAMHGSGSPYQGVVKRRDGKPLPLWNGRATFLPERLDQPLRWTKPRLVFVNSMSDLFHEDVTNEQIAAVFGVMAAAPRHTFQVLTKRSKRMREWFDWWQRSGLGTAGTVVMAMIRCGLSEAQANRVAQAKGFPLPNVWLGVSAEDQQRADERIPDLLACPAAVRWVSAEPLLGSIDFADYLKHPAMPNYVRRGPDRVRVVGLDWIVVGGESGGGARGCDLAWIRDIVEQGTAANAPVFVKQLGARPYAKCEVCTCVPEEVRYAQTRDCDSAVRLKSSKGGDPAEWPAELRVREWPTQQKAPYPDAQPEPGSDA